MKSIKKQVFIFLAILFITTSVFAHPAQDLIEQSTLDMLKVLSEKSERIKDDPEYLRQLVDEKLIPHLDFKSMTALSLGKHWRKATEEQKDTLVEEFKKLMINTYMSALTLYSGQTMQFKPYVKNKRDDRAVVKALFIQPGSKGVPVSYKLRKKADGWKVYNIDVNSINLISTYRTTFSQKITQSGIESLIDEMKQKNISSEKKS